MSLDNLKKELISFMEKIHASIAYPRNFFGCLTTLILENEPVAQDRIMELTGYSRAAVSSALQKVQFIMPIAMTRKSGDKKHYYEYTHSVEGFLLHILEKRIDMPDINLDMIQEIKEKAQSRSMEHPSFQKLGEYLDNLYTHLQLIYKIRVQSVEPLIRVLNTGKFKDTGLPQASELDTKEISEFLENLAASPKSEIQEPSNIETNPPLGYWELKSQYFKGVRNSLNPLFSQSAANQVIVIHDVLIENRLTQEMIEKSTNLPRSTISEVLTLAVKQGIIREERIQSSRIKVYIPKITLSTLLIGFYDRTHDYAYVVKNKLSDLIRKAKSLESQTVDSKKFLEKLVRLERAYTIILEFTLRTKVVMIQNLRGIPTFVSA
jgi:DNA-binding transcriptional regulator GbsR (MarR family)